MEAHHRAVGKRTVLRNREKRRLSQISGSNRILQGLRAKESGKGRGRERVGPSIIFGFFVTVTEPVSTAIGLIESKSA